MMLIITKNFDIRFCNIQLLKSFIEVLFNDIGVKSHKCITFCHFVPKVMQIGHLKATLSQGLFAS